MDINYDALDSKLFDYGMDCESKHSKFLPIFDSETELFHYTSAKSLTKILRSDSPVLRFSRQDCLNDKSEGIHAIQVYRKVCDELLRDEIITSTFYNQIIDISPLEEKLITYNEPENTTIAKFKKCQRFVCCFSTESDSLPMWNYYCKGNKYEGFNIGFDFFDTQDSGIQTSFGKEYQSKFLKVIYKDLEKENIIKKLIIELLVYQDLENSFSRIKSIISMYLDYWSMCFKNKCFEHEKEIRLVIDVPLDSHTQYENISHVMYRTNNGLIIPYVDVRLEKEAIVSVKAGPLMCSESEKENQKNIIKEMLDKLNYNKIDVSFSDVPIRFLLFYVQGYCISINLVLQ